MRLETRQADPRIVSALVNAGCAPLVARLAAARGVQSARELDTDLAGLHPPALLTRTAEAARLLADAIERGQRLLIVADYDCDGATACAVGVRGLTMLGAQVGYHVPNRFEHGYGLTPEIVDIVAQQHKPDWIITVDNGIASHAGVARANALGMAVLVTDHHLPASRDAADLPAAACIVNPNQPECGFPSKHLAGVGVMFYVLLALRAELRQRGRFGADGRTQPRLDSLLDLVALGTVADVVRLDANNRLLVAQGLARIRTGRCQPGIAALLQVAGREARTVTTMDLGFALGPRLNAAGRLADMSLGIECLVTNDAVRAAQIAGELDGMNRARRDIEADMKETALAALERLQAAPPATAQPAARAATVCLYDPAWHPGVVGILAGRLKEQFHRPAFVFAPAGGAEPGMLRGSGRSIEGLHLRDALDLVSKLDPGLLARFGGHAMAAGVSLAEADFPTFAKAFETVVAKLLDPALLTRTLWTDGPLPDSEANLATITALDNQVWGQGFAPPLFCDLFRIERQRLLKDKHLKLWLKKLQRQGQGPEQRLVPGAAYEAIWFNHAELLGGQAHVVYRIAADHYNGMARVQLIVEHAEPAD